MKILLLLVMLLLSLVAACATGQTQAPTAAPPTLAPPTGGQDMRSMLSQPTSTPGSMVPTNPDASHMMEPIDGTNAQPASANEGAQPLAPRMEGDVKVFDLTTQLIRWNLLDDITATAMSYNGTVPGPLLRVTEGDTVRVNVKNNLAVPTTVHWHGIDVPNAMDGVPDVTQKAIQPGETFVYEFEAKPSGTFMYHSHFESDIQVSAGLYGPFIIDPKTDANAKPAVDELFMISEWRVTNGETFAAMPMAGMEPNYFTLNGKAFPTTKTIKAKAGDLVRLRFMGIGQFVHPMHLHGTSFKIVETDGHPVPEAAQLTKDTVLVAPGERYVIEFTAVPGKWMLHCHILHHTTNDNVDPGGLMVLIDVSE